MLKDRAQQVVLAVATFDAEGRLLVSQSGLMPCQTITRQFHQRVSTLKSLSVFRTNEDRPSTKNSTFPIQSFSGFSESLETGQASLNSFHPCANTCK